MYFAPPAVDVAQQSPWYSSGVVDFDLHDRLQQNRVGLLEGVLEGEDARHFEGHFVGIHLVEGAVDDLDLDINDLVAGIDAALAGLLDAVNDRRECIPWEWRRRRSC